MTSTSTSTSELDDADAIREEVRRTIQQLARLAETEHDFGLFCQETLDRVVKITGAHGALFWQISRQGRPKLTHLAGQAPHDRAREILSPDNVQHTDAVLDVVAQQKPLSVDSESFGPRDFDDDADMTAEQIASAFLMLFSPVFDSDKKCCGAVELIQRGDVTPDARSGYLNFLGEIAVNFQRWHQLQAAREEAAGTDVALSPQTDIAPMPSMVGADWNQRMEFISEVHRSIDLKETAYAIANESRRMLKCDRVSVARFNGRRCKVEAISSQDRFDNRANVVRKLGNVATASVKADMPFWIVGETTGIAPEVALQINDYLDESHSRTFAVIPLAIRPADTPDLEMKGRHKRKRPKKLGALILEYFDADVSEDSVRDDCDLIIAQSQLALDNARRHQEIFLQPVWKRLGWLQKTLFGDHRAKTITGLVALGLLTLAMIFLPTELTMKVSGVLQPQVRQHVYAETGGVVEEIFFEDKQEVAEKDLLIRLRNLDLSLEMEALRGQMATTRQQLETLNFQLARSGLQREQRQQLTGERRVLEQQLTTLNRTTELNEKKLAAQEIVAPIDGQVITWNPEQRLRGLVIKPNDIVLTLSKLDGPWQLEVKIPQNKVGYIDTATGKSDEPLNVEFTLGTNPNETFAGTLNRISIRPTPDDSGVPNYRGLIDVATVDADRFKALRPGVGVTAKIECGQVPLYKYCFHQIIDWLNVNVFF